MPGRGLTAEMLVAISADAQEPFHLVELQYSGGTQYLCDARASVEWSGHTWVSDGNLLDVGDIESALSLRVSNLDVVLAGSLTNIALALGGTWRNRAAIVYRALFALDGRVVVDPAVVYSGEMDSWSLVEDPTTGSSELTWKLVSEFEDFDRIAGRTTNNDSNRVHYPNEAGFDRAHVVVRDLKWGRK